VLGVGGHTIWLRSLEYVRLYVKVNKNDSRNADAIAEAAYTETVVPFQVRGFEAVASGAGVECR